MIIKTGGFTDAAITAWDAKLSYALDVGQKSTIFEVLRQRFHVLVSDGNQTNF